MDKRMTPRGIRNNNPGNIRHGIQKWQGQSVYQPDPEFVRFDTPQHGIRAIMKIIETYYDKYSLLTIKAIITKYAPPVENDTDSYISAVSKMSGIAADAVVDDITQLLIPIAKAISLHENGAAPVALPAYWYADSVYEEAKQMVNS